MTQLSAFKNSEEYEQYLEVSDSGSKLKILVDDFDYIAILGQGGFGRVVHARKVRHILRHHTRSVGAHPFHETTCSLSVCFFLSLSILLALLPYPLYYLHVRSNSCSHVRTHARKTLIYALASSKHHNRKLLECTLP